MEKILGKLREKYDGKQWFVFSEQLLYRFQDDHVMEIGAQLAYYLILAIFPFIIFFLSILQFTPLADANILQELLSPLPGDTKELFLETLDEINTVARTAKQEIEEKFIATIACKAAVKANMALTKEEVDNLMKQLLRLPNPFTCPHGRPTAIKMTRTDIEKKFSRR